MTKRAAVTHQGLVRDATNFRVVKDGVAREVVRALKVCNGVACEFWPRLDFTTSVIVWDTTEVFSVDVQTDPADAQAAIQFLLADGNAYIDNTPPGGTLPVPYVTPPITATGQLLLRWNTVSGTLNSNVTENVWFDMFSNGGSFIASVWVDQADPGFNLASADIDIADDTGGGVPGTITTKRVNFHAEVVNSSDVVMSTLQWDLEHLTINADALTTLSLSPDGVVRGWEGPALILSERYALEGVDSSLFTAQLDLISGDAPTSGPALGAPFNLVAAASWALESTVHLTGFTGEYDLTVVGPLDSVTKRVTMNVLRTDDFSANLVWTTTPYAIAESGVANGSTVDIDHFSNGTADLSTVGIVEPPGWPQDWHAEAPAASDPEDYEVNMKVVFGDAPSGSPYNTWLPANGNYNWSWVLQGQVDPPVGGFIVSGLNYTYRRVGQPSTETEKSITFDIYRDAPP